MRYSIKRYHIDVDSKGATACTALMGLAFFLRALYYFGLTRTETVPFGELLLMMVLPMVLEGAFMVFLRGLRLDLPLLYGVLGALACVLLLIQGCQDVGVLRMVLVIVAYVLLGALLVCTSLGLLTKQIALTAILVVGIVRFYLALKPYIFTFRPVAFLTEAAGLCVVFALAGLVSGLYVKKK